MSIISYYVFFIFFTILMSARVPYCTEYIPTTKLLYCTCISLYSVFTFWSISCCWLMLHYLGSILYYNTVISYSLSIHFSPSCYTYTPFGKGSIQFFRSLKHSYETNFLFFTKVRFHEVLTFLKLAISHVCFSCFHQSDKKLHFR